MASRLMRGVRQFSPARRLRFALAKLRGSSSEPHGRVVENNRRRRVEQRGVAHVTRHRSEQSVASHRRVPSERRGDERRIAEPRPRTNGHSHRPERFARVGEESVAEAQGRDNEAARSIEEQLDRLHFSPAAHARACERVNQHMQAQLDHLFRSIDEVHHRARINEAIARSHPHGADESPPRANVHRRSTEGQARAHEQLRMEGQLQVQADEGRRRLGAPAQVGGVRVDRRRVPSRRASDIRPYRQGHTRDDRLRCLFCEGAEQVLDFDGLCPVCGQDGGSVVGHFNNANLVPASLERADDAPPDQAVGQEAQGSSITIKGAPAARECHICMAELIDTEFQPCCHSVACQSCARQVLDNGAVCPICRGKVTQFDVGHFKATLSCPGRAALEDRRRCAGEQARANDARCRRRRAGERIHAEEQYPRLHRALGGA